MNIMLGKDGTPLFISRSNFRPYQRSANVLKEPQCQPIKLQLHHPLISIPARRQTSVKGSKQFSKEIISQIHEGQAMRVRKINDQGGRVARSRIKTILRIVKIVEDSDVLPREYIVECRYGCQKKTCLKKIDETRLRKRDPNLLIDFLERKMRIKDPVND